MKKTLGSLPLGARFKFAGSEFIKGVESTISNSEAFACKAVAVEATVYITAAALVEIEVEEEKIHGLYSQINFSVAVRLVNDTETASIIAKEGGIITLSERHHSEHYKGAEYNFKATAEQAGRIAQAIDKIEQKAANEGHGFD